MVRIMRLIGFLIVAFVSTSLTAQIGIGGGMSTLFEFGNRRPFVGLNLHVESPRNNDVTFYGRMTYQFKQNGFFDYGVTNAQPINPLGATIQVPIQAAYSINYFIIDGGSRYYLINGFDEGFSLYGGTNVGLIINSASYNDKYKLGNYDQSSYVVDQTYQSYLPEGSRSTFIRLALGFTGGAKYTIPGVGSVYVDLNPYLSLFGIPSKDDFPREIYRQVFFNINVGFRKELYW